MSSETKTSCRRWTEFLSTGCCKSPCNIFRNVSETFLKRFWRLSLIINCFWVVSASFWTKNVIFLKKNSTFLKNFRSEFVQPRDKKYVSFKTIFWTLSELRSEWLLKAFENNGTFNNYWNHSEMFLKTVFSWAGQEMLLFQKQFLKYFWTHFWVLSLIIFWKTFVGEFRKEFKLVFESVQNWFAWTNSEGLSKVLRKCIWTHFRKKTECFCQFSETKFRRIFSIFSEIHFETFQKRFWNVFDQLLTKFSKTVSKIVNGLLQHPVVIVNP